MEKMIIEGETTESSDAPIEEESLMSLEKLDRASPELWPEESIAKFVAQNSPMPVNATWTSVTSAADTQEMYRLGQMSVNELVSEVKKMHDTAYNLGIEEAKEMTRGKYLNIFRPK